jgi:transglutaminase-like putative cysteine protease
MKKYHLLLIITLFSYIKIIAQKYKIEKEPLWVKNTDIPKKSTFSKYEISSGYYLTLADYQFNLDENSIFTREVINVISYSGITKASQISITYDSSYQKLKIHHLYVRRNGELIDRTKDLSFEKINNEFALNDGIYSGQITAYDNLDDIRKDDYIDFSYTLTGKNPIFEKEKYLFIPLESENQIDLLHVGILYSKTKNYQYKLVNRDSSVIFSESTTNTHKQIEININNIKAINLEENIPAYEIPYKYFTLSSFKNWADVNTWAQNIFTLKNEPNLESVFKEIFTGKETMDDKINKILNFVQDDIRYMGIEAGIGSIKPLSPEQVIKQRFGDCKDKSLLLVTLLKKIGITEAFPALVNTTLKQKTDQFFPTNEIFDHCIVSFNYNKKTYWIDPTFTQQGGDFKNMAIANFHKALIIGINSDSLSKMEPQEFISNTNITDELTMTSFFKPANLVITSSRVGLEADQRRTVLEQYASTDLSNWVTDDLRKFYPTVNKTEDIKISDDIIQNSLTTTYNYNVDGFWQDGDKLNDRNFSGYMIFKFEPTTLYDYLSVSTCQSRKNDFQLNYPLNIQYKAIFKLPKELLIMDDYVKYDNVTFFFDQKKEQLNSTTFQVTYNFKIKAETIKAEDFVKVCEEKNAIAKTLPILIYLKK